MAGGNEAETNYSPGLSPIVAARRNRKLDKSFVAKFMKRKESI